MHKLDAFLSFSQPSGVFLSSSCVGKKKKKNVKTFFLPTSGSLSIGGVQLLVKTQLLARPWILNLYSSSGPRTINS